MKYLNNLRCRTPVWVAIAALFFTLVLNSFFLVKTWQSLPWRGLHDTLFAISVPITLFAAFTLLLTLLALPLLRKPLLVILILAAAAANYFHFSFGAEIDRNMMANVFETNMQETLALVNPRFLLWMLLMGVLPAVLFTAVRITPSRNFWRALAWRACLAGGSLIVILLMAAAFYKDYAATFRNHHELPKMVTPANVVSGLSHYVADRWFSGPQTLIKIGTDAHKGQTISQAQRKTLVIFVLGETARAENFSLGGYGRQTAPLLAKYGVIYYQHATSCGTETAVSVPCMFSNMPRSSYQPTLAQHQEGLMDVMAHAGVNLLWRENDGGCKGACDRIPHTDMTHWKLPEWCHDGFCQDDALLYRLNDYIGSVKDDSVIVLHQMGSHGPAYYLRYPQQMRKFTPTCDSNQIQECDHQSLVNTYDNTLLYTDAMLDQTITLLKGWQDKFNVALIYLSDHGESLGEHGLYLHGTPYVIAPDQQTHIPMLLWLSDGYASTYGVDLSCMQQQASQEAASQDNVFHTLLGMMNIATREYQPALDLLQPCRRIADGK